MRRTYGLAEITVDLTAEDVELGREVSIADAGMSGYAYVVSGGTGHERSAEEEGEKRRRT